MYVLQLVVPPCFPVFVIYLNNAFLAFIFCPLLTDCYFVDNQHVTDSLAKHGLLCRERWPFSVRKTAFYTTKGGISQTSRQSAVTLTVFASAS